jgi:hypothetical protein
MAVHQILHLLRAVWPAVHCWGLLLFPNSAKDSPRVLFWGIGLCLDGITYSFLYWVPSVEIVMIMLFLHGIGIPLIMVSRTSIIQAHTPNKYHGRLFAVVHLGVVGTTAISSALVGIISAVVSIKLLFFAIGVGATLYGLLALVVAPIRQLN